MAAYLIVRAELVEPAVKEDFDRWYQEEHLAAARQAFQARRAVRGWSQVDAAVHYAVYEFDDLAAASAIQGSAALQRLVAEFDRRWGDKVRRHRDVVELI
jgi:hypothetical protein